MDILELINVFQSLFSFGIRYLQVIYENANVGSYTCTGVKGYCRYLAL